MQNKIKNKHIEKRFSLAAETYDASKDIQLAVAENLKNIISKSFDGEHKINNAIDIGCGTGLMTEQVHSLFPDIEIIGVDISKDMVEFFNRKFAATQNAKAIHSDFLQFNHSLHFDMAFSSCALHWISPIEDAIKKTHQLLNKNAPFFCGMTVQGTFEEFFRLKKEIAPDKVEENQLFSGSQVIKLMKKNGFSIIEAEEKNFVIQYDSTRDFIKTIHQQGTTAGFSKTSLLTRKELEKLINLYDKQFMSYKNKIEVNYKILFFRAEKI